MRDTNQSRNQLSLLNLFSINVKLQISKTLKNYVFYIYLKHSLKRSKYLIRKSKLQFHTHFKIALMRNIQDFLPWKYDFWFTRVRSKNIISTLPFPDTKSIKCHSHFIHACVQKENLFTKIRIHMFHVYIDTILKHFNRANF